MAISIALYSLIPVVLRDGRYHTMDLWARDLEVQVRYARCVKLVCRVAPAPPPAWTATACVPPGVQVVPCPGPGGAGLDDVFRDSDVLQVPGTQGWRDGAMARRLIREARSRGVPWIVGISSNRARATLLNAEGRGALARLKAWVKYVGIRTSQRSLTAGADGVFVVGEGLKPLVSGRCRALHVGIASWVREADLEVAERRLAEGSLPPLDRICTAARLERMKGTHLGIEALALLAADGRGPNLQLDVMGSGPEQAALQRQAAELGLASRVRFLGTRTYPHEFLRALGEYGLVLLTNLSDEQPRLIFDAISQGAIPICPAAEAYRSLGLPPELQYRQGDAADLARSIDQVRRHPDPRVLFAGLLETARSFTLDAMHRARVRWIRTEVLARSGGSPA